MGLGKPNAQAEPLDQPRWGCSTPEYQRRCLGFPLPIHDGKVGPGRCTAKGLFVRDFLASSGVLCACRPHSCEGSWRVGLGRDWAAFGLATPRVFVRVYPASVCVLPTFTVGMIESVVSCVHGGNSDFAFILPFVFEIFHPLKV